MTIYTNQRMPFAYRMLLGAFFSILMLLCVSCTDNDTPILDDQNGYVTITVSTPYSAPRTYAMDDVADNTVESIEVLAFRLENGKELYTYKAVGKEIEDDGGINKKKFQVMLRKDENLDYRFVIIANATEELAKLTTTQSAEKELLLARLLSENKDQWNTSQKFKPIPMWGEAPELIRVTENTKVISDIHLLRAVVSIDVTVGSGAQSEFKLKEAYLYNRITRGRIYPNMNYYDPVEKVVTLASMPLDNQGEQNPLKIWSGLKHEALSTQEMSKIIYTYESKLAENDGNATCIVVGGEYKNKMTYYRLDFYHIDQATGAFTGYKDLLRNHRYTINISSVIDYGYDTPDEAFYGKKVGMSAEIEDWNMSGMPEVEIDENYYLTISQGLFEISSKEVYQGMVTIETDHPKSWSASSTDGWITNVRKEGNLLYFTLGTLSSGSREGKITVTAGNLTKIIKIVQSAS